MIRLKPRDAAFCFVSFDQRFLLVRRSQTARVRAGEWDLPGGKIEIGEDHAKAAVREGSEEVGLHISLQEGYFETTFPTRGRRYYYYVASSDSDKVQLSYEHDAYQWVDSETVKKLLQHPPHKIAAENLLE